MTRNETLFYILSFTWGLPMTFIGCAVAIVLLALGYRPRRWGYCYFFEVGEYWGGVNLGPIFIANKNSTEHTRNHELGHAIENCVFGPMMPFLVSIPSAIRYWYREWLVRSEQKKYSELPPYDSVWYEGWATLLGTRLIRWYENNTK